MFFTFHTKINKNSSSYISCEWWLPLSCHNNRRKCIKKKIVKTVTIYVNSICSYPLPYHHYTVRIRQKNNYTVRMPRHAR